MVKVTGTYDYDSFGNLIHSTGAIPSESVSAGQLYDRDLHLFSGVFGIAGRNNVKRWPASIPDKAADGGQRGTHSGNACLLQAMVCEQAAIPWSIV
jgi:hypothetical protein